VNGRDGMVERVSIDEAFSDGRPHGADPCSCRTDPSDAAKSFCKDVVESARSTSDVPVSALFVIFDFRRLNLVGHVREHRLSPTAHGANRV
jgi:hypothetical protein